MLGGRTGFRIAFREQLMPTGPKLPHRPPRHEQTEDDDDGASAKWHGPKITVATEIERNEERKQYCGWHHDDDGNHETCNPCGPNMTKSASCGNQVDCEEPCCEQVEEFMVESEIPDELGDTQ
jgi:hypothetical protein